MRCDQVISPTEVHDRHLTFGLCPWNPFDVVLTSLCRSSDYSQTSSNTLQPFLHSVVPPQWCISVLCCFVAIRLELEREQRALSLQRAALEKEAGALQQQVAALLERRYIIIFRTAVEGLASSLFFYAM